MTKKYLIFIKKCDKILLLFGIMPIFIIRNLNPCLVYTRLFARLGKRGNFILEVVFVIVDRYFLFNIAFIRNSFNGKFFY
jgi:hypothetical protein